jgi:prepilin peptidase CpaA
MLLGLEARQLTVLCLSALACGFDIRTRHIPNALTFGGAACAVLYAAATGGAGGALTATLGWGTGFALFLPFFLLGGLGAGDVKLIACLGAWLGPDAAMWLALYAAMAGGVMGLVVALATGYLRQAIANVSLLFLFWQTEGLRPLPELTLGEARGPRLPYALPIAAGTLALFFAHLR